MEMFFKQAHYEYVPITIDDFLTNQVKYLKADLAFQASAFTRWKPEQGSAYITSILNGEAPSPFIFADIKRCLEVAKQNENQTDIEYYQWWAKKLKHKLAKLNLDSNNRTINLVKFFKNQIRIVPGRYVDDTTGITYNIKKGKQDTYKTMPSVLRQRFLSQEIMQVIYYDVGREQLSSIFENINNGKPLIGPEKRNARTSDIANVIRSLATEYYKWFTNKDTKWFDTASQKRRGVDDFIAGLAHIYFNGIDVKMGEQNLSDMYLVNSPASLGAVRFKNFFKNFMSFVSKDLYAIPNKNSILDLFVIYNDMARDNRQLKPKIKSEKFVNDYIKKVVSLIDKETFTLNPYQKKAKEKKTFYKMLGGRQHYNNQYRRDLIRKKLNLDKYFVQLDNTRVVSNKTKLVVAVKHQKGKTYEGKDIDLSKLQSGKYHKGHKEPHRIGGKATKENTVIQENMDNWKLGSKTIN